MAEEYFETGSKKGRGRAKKTIDLIDAMYMIAAKAQPITGRGIGYKLFSQGLISSMKEMPRVYRYLKEAREEGIVPWHWIVDETREVERVSTWDDPAQYVRAVSRSYRRNFWNEQSQRVVVWSEKGTVRGVLAPVLDTYGVDFRVMHGFSGATTVHDVAQDNDDDRELIALYVGDIDPSGMWMSEKDLPTRLEKYGGDHITLERVAVLFSQTRGLGSFPASDKRKDPRYKWFVANYGHVCWELDAMDPNDLRACVEKAIQENIEQETWDRCRTVEKAEQESLRTVLDNWKAAKHGR